MAMGMVKEAQESIESLESALGICKLNLNSLALIVSEILL